MPYTAIYQLYFPGLGDPIRDTRAGLESNARTIEAALKAGGIAPAGAPDIAAVAGRVNRLENPPRAMLRQSTGESGFAAGAWRTVTMQTEDVDTHNGHSLTVNPWRWTCPAGEGGTYQVTGTVTFGAVTVGSVINARILKNGGTIPAGVGAGGSYGGPAGNTATTGPKDVVLAAGDFVEVQGYCNAAWSTAVFADSASSLTIRRVAL